MTVQRCARALSLSFSLSLVCCLQSLLHCDSTEMCNKWPENIYTSASKVRRAYCFQWCAYVGGCVRNNSLLTQIYYKNRVTYTRHQRCNGCIGFSHLCAWVGVFAPKKSSPIDWLQKQGDFHPGIIVTAGVLFAVICVSGCVCHKSLLTLKNTYTPASKVQRRIFVFSHVCGCVRDCLRLSQKSAQTNILQKQDDFVFWFQSFAWVGVFSQP